MLAVEQPYVFRALGFSAVLASADMTRLAILIHTLRAATINTASVLPSTIFPHTVREIGFSSSSLTQVT